MPYPQYQRQPFGAKDYTSLGILASNIDDAESRQMRNDMAELSKTQELQEKGFTRDTLSKLAGTLQHPDTSPEEAKRAMAQTTIDLLSYGGQHSGEAAQALSKIQPFEEEQSLLGSEDVKGAGGALDRVYQFGHKGPSGKDVITKLQPVSIRPGMSVMERLMLIDRQNKGKLDVEGMRNKGRIEVSRTVRDWQNKNKTKAERDTEYKEIQGRREGIKKELQQLKAKLIPLPAGADSDGYIYQRWLDGEEMRQRANDIAAQDGQQALPVEEPPFDAAKMKEMEQKYGGVQDTKFRKTDYPDSTGDTFDDLFQNQ